MAPRKAKTATTAAATPAATRPAPRRSLRLRNSEQNTEGFYREANQARIQRPNPGVEERPRAPGRPRGPRPTSQPKKDKKKDTDKTKKPVKEKPGAKDQGSQTQSPQNPGGKNQGLTNPGGKNQGPTNQDEQDSQDDVRLPGKRGKREKKTPKRLPPRTAGAK